MRPASKAGYYGKYVLQYSSWLAFYQAHITEACV